MIDFIIETVREELASNQFLSGGFILMVLGSLLVILRKIPDRILSFCKRRFTASIEIMGDDTSFRWIQTWLAYRQWGRQIRQLTVVSKKRDYDEDPEKEMNVLYAPAPGHYLSKHCGWPVLVGVIREDKKIDNMFFGFRHQITITTLFRGRVFLESIVKEAFETYQSVYENNIEILFPLYGDWGVIQRTPPRPLESVILGDSVKDRLVADIDHFFHSSNWYHEKGIPWKRGYLLHGPPGNGKTSLVKALAGHFKSNVYVLNLSGIQGDQKLVELMVGIPARSILLIEDLDSVFKGRTYIGKGGSSKDENTGGDITFSGLLNAVDGITSQEGILFFITSNLKESIDKTLIRPGRIDVQLNIDNPQTEQIERLVYRLLDEPTDINVKKMVKELSLSNSSMAEVQNYLMKHRNGFGKDAKKTAVKLRCKEVADAKV